MNRALRKDQITPKRLGFFGPSRNVPGKQRVLACAAKRTLVCRSKRQKSSSRFRMALLALVSLLVSSVPIPCPLGRYRSQVTVGAQRSRPFCQTCARGRFVALLPPGAIEPSDGRDACLATCPAGQYTAARRACVLCPRGKFRARGAAAAVCWSCAAGTFGARAGARSVLRCELCPAGRVAPGTAARQCASCAALAKRSYQFAAGMTRCDVASAGTQAAAAPEKGIVGGHARGTAARSCGPGRFLAAAEQWRQGPAAVRSHATPGTGTCARCPEGRLGRWPAAAECSPLLQAATAAEIAQARSVVCPVGSLPRQATDASGAGCAACPPGQHWRATAIGGTGSGAAWAASQRLQRVGALAGATAIGSSATPDQAAQAAAAAVAGAGGNDAQVVHAAGESAFAGTLTTLGEFHTAAATGARAAARRSALRAYAWYVDTALPGSANATVGAWTPPERASDAKRSCVPCTVGRFASTPGLGAFRSSCQPCDALWPGAGTNDKRGASVCTHGGGLRLIKQREAQERVQRAAAREDSAAARETSWHRWAAARCAVLLVEVTGAATRCGAGAGGGISGLYLPLQTTPFAFRLMGVQPCAAAHGASRAASPVTLWRGDGATWRIGTTQQPLFSVRCSGPCTGNAPPRDASWSSSSVAQHAVLKVHCIPEGGGDSLQHARHASVPVTHQAAGGASGNAIVPKPPALVQQRHRPPEHRSKAPRVSLPTLPPAFFSPAFAHSTAAAAEAAAAARAAAQGARARTMHSARTRGTRLTKVIAGASVCVLLGAIAALRAWQRVPPKDEPASALFETQMLLNQDSGSASHAYHRTASEAAEEATGPQFRFEASQFKAL